MGMIFTWTLALEALSLATWPLARRALPGAVDGGWAASRVLGPLLLSLLVGTAAVLHLVAYQRQLIAIVTVVGGALVWAAWRPLGRPRWPTRAALMSEAVFLATFAAALGLRSLFPAADDNERPMDFSFLNAFVRSDALPPTDPWFAGQPIAYYTFGYLSWANVIRLTAIPVEVAYNLAVASVLATAVSLAWSTAASCRGRVADGFLAAVTLALVGNLRTFVDWLIMAGAGSVEWWAGWSVTTAVASPGPGWVYWLQASRVIPNILPEGITEFPFLSLIVGDLHPHYMAIGTNVLAVALAFAAVRGAPLGLVIPLAAATLGALTAGNTWNVPGAAALLAVGVAYRFCLPRVRPWHAMAALAALVGSAAVLSVPFLIDEVAAPLSVAWTPAASRLWPGTFLVLFLPYGLALTGVLVAHAPSWRRWPVVLGCWTAAILAGQLLAEAGVAMLLAGSGIAMMVLAVRAALVDDPLQAALLVACGVAVGLVLIPEVVFLDDYFGTRMNTVFKFYFQALVFLGVALPSLVTSLSQRMAAPLHTRSAMMLRRGAVYAGLLTLLYVPLGPLMRMAVSPPGGTLDALAFLAKRAPDDLAAMYWLRDRAPPGSVIIEAVDRQDPVGLGRTDIARFSAFSGEPTLVGWTQHEQQWRGRLPAIEQRLEAVAEVYQGSTPERAAQVLQAYDVGFVVVGQTERQRYGQHVDERFRGWLETVFEAGRTTIFRVPLRHSLAPTAGPTQQSDATTVSGAAH